MAIPQTIVQIGGSGTAFFDVTSYATSVTISRGLSRQLDRFTTGTANLTFTNQTRIFEPENTYSSLYPYIKPKKNMLISTVVAGSTAVQFTGRISDWDFSYQTEGAAVASASCVDGFDEFSGQLISGHTPVAQKTGERIAAILNRSEVNWPLANRSLDTGSQTLQADVIEEGRDVLEYLNIVSSSEPGLLYMTKENYIEFKDRTAGSINTAYFGATVVVFSTQANDEQIGYTDIAFTYGSDFLYNRVSVSSLGIETQVGNNATSQSEYGVNNLELNGLLLPLGAQGTSDAQALAGYYSLIYGEPDFRIDTISVNLGALNATKQSQVLDIDIGDTIRVYFYPTVAVSSIPTVIDENLIVIGIRHNIRPDQHTMDFFLQSTTFQAFVFGFSEEPTEYPNGYSLFAGDGVIGSPFGL
jgi:hypothetical protein